MTSPSTAPVRLGVIGAGGRMCHVLGHLLAAAPTGRIAVTAAHDPDPEALTALRKVCRCDFEEVKSEEALVCHAKVDWVFIGSWNVFHARQAVAALLAGKNVFCEKPLATTLEDCLAVRDAVNQSGRVFAFGLVLRYSPLYQKIREWVMAGRIGRIISFEFNETLGFNHGGYIFGNWRRRRANSGSHLLEKCCHDLDLVNWITGSLPVRVASFGGRDFFVSANAHHVERIGPNAEGKPAYGTWPDPGRVSPFSDGADIVDNQVAILEYASGARAAFHTNCNAGLPERRMYLCGTEGSLRADAVTGTIELQRIGHEPRIERIETGAAGGHAGGDEMMAQGLVATLLEGRAPLASIEEAVRSCVAAFAIDQAMAEGRVVDLDSWWKAAGIGLEEGQTFTATT
jgi:predicted dehydrogenase